MFSRSMCAVVVLVGLVGCGGVSPLDEAEAGGAGGSAPEATAAVATTVYVEVPEGTGGSAVGSTSGAVEAGGTSAVATSVRAGSTTSAGGVAAATGGSKSSSAAGGSSQFASSATGGAEVVVSSTSPINGGTSAIAWSSKASATVANCDKSNQDNDQLCWYKPNPEDPSKCMSVLNLGGGDVKYTNDIRTACAADGNRMCNQGTESGYLNNPDLFSASDCFTLCVVCYREKKSDRLSDECLAMRAQYDDELSCLSPVGY